MWGPITHVYCLPFYIFKFFLRKKFIFKTPSEKNLVSLNFSISVFLPTLLFEGISVLGTAKTRTQMSSFVAWSPF